MVAPIQHPSGAQSRPKCAAPLSHKYLNTSKHLEYQIALHPSDPAAAAAHCLAGPTDSKRVQSSWGCLDTLRTGCYYTSYCLMNTYSSLPS